MKSLNIDAILPWEIGLLIIVIGFISIIIGVRQSKKLQEDFDKIPLTKARVKFIWGFA